MEKKYVLSVRMDHDLSQKLKYIAEAEDRSTSQQALRAIRDFVNHYESEHGPIPTSSE